MGARDAIAKLLTGIKAYHSSPHDFDRFDLSKIGTGEGAQAYGHGLYFAENPKVSGQGGQYWNQFMSRFPEGEREIAERLEAHGFNRNATAETVQRQIDELQRRLDPGGVFDKPHLADAQSRTKNYIAELSAERDRLLSGNPVGPRTYEVNIKADPAQMLDWDKPLREQQQLLDALSGSRRKAVKETLERQDYQAPTRVTYGTDIGPVTGQDFYKALSYNMTGKPGSAQASQAMQAGGVPAIKYLDEGSRGRAADIADVQRSIEKYKDNPYGIEGWQNKLEQLQQQPLTSNYVVFDPANVDILKKYGVVGAPAGALTMGALAGQDQYEAPP